MTGDELSSSTQEGDTDHEERSDGGLAETDGSRRLTSRASGVSTGIETDRNLLNLAATTQIAWMLVILAGTLGFGIWTPELYFILSFIGLLAVSLLFVPADRNQTWWVGLRWIVRACFVILGYIVFRRAESILGPIVG